MKALPETDALSSAWSTRQSLENTRQTLCRVWHLAKKSRWHVHRQWFLCRVLFVRHSIKTLPSVIQYSAKKSCRHDASDSDCTECLLYWHSAKAPSLLSVYCIGSRQRSTSWVPLLVPLLRVFGDTRQRIPLCWVPYGLALGKGSTSGPLCQFLCRVH
jgi:hypothetical protein